MAAAKSGAIVTTWSPLLDRSAATESVIETHGAVGCTRKTSRCAPARPAGHPLHRRGSGSGTDAEPDAELGRDPRGQSRVGRAGENNEILAHWSMVPLAKIRPSGTEVLHRRASTAARAMSASVRS